MFTYNYVYIMNALNTPLYKIGVSNNPFYLKQLLERDTDYLIEIVSCLLGGKYASEIEGILHEFFKKRRLSENWFLVEPSLMNAQIVHIQSSREIVAGSCHDIFEPLCPEAFRETLFDDRQYAFGSY